MRCMFWSKLMILWLFAQVQINNDMKDDTFTELPVSLVLFSLICIDVVERIRHCRLTGQGEHITLNILHHRSQGAIDPELSPTVCPTASI